MLYYDRVDLREGIDFPMSSNSKEYMTQHYWFFNHKFKFENSVCDDCRDVTMLPLDKSGIVIITTKGVYYDSFARKFCTWLSWIYIEFIQKKSTSLSLWKFNRTKKLETINILIDKRSYKVLAIYFTRYHL